MKTATTALIVLVLIALGAGWYMHAHPRREAPTTTNSEPVSDEVDTAIRAQVMAFGEKLKNISLLQPKASLGPNMVAEYGAYVDSTLLRTWEDNPESALGRLTSSPWPDHIEIVEITKVNDDTYRVEGNVVEITSADTPSHPASVYPVTLTVRRNGNTWLIVAAQKGTSSQPPQPVSATAIEEQ